MISKMEKLLLLIDKLYPDAKLSDTELSDFKMIASGTKRILLFVKRITGEIGLYNHRISYHVFGPEVIHEDDYKKLQLHMHKSEIRQCVYIIHSTDLNIFAHQYTFPLDTHYITWLTDE